MLTEQTCANLYANTLRRTEFVGGVSDGSVGMTVMDYRPHGAVEMRRTWSGPIHSHRPQAGRTCRREPLA